MTWGIRGSGGGASPASPDRRTLWRTWVVTRVVMLTLCVMYHGLTGDLRYYAHQSHAHSLLHGMPEYPLGVAVALMAPARIMPTLAFGLAYVAVAVLADAWMIGVLTRHVGVRTAWWWTVLIALHGPLTYVRFDLYVAIPLALVLVCARSRPFGAGVSAAVGSAVKMWPAVFGVGLLGPRRRRLTHMAGAAIGGLAWAGATVAVAGFDRLVSPLTWQGKRGFEIESFWGGFLGFERALGSSVVFVEKRQGSYEYTGAVATQWMGIVKPTQYVGYLLILVLVALGAWAGRDARRTTAALTMTAVISVFVLTSPVISPQYLVWLVPGLVFVDDARLRRLGCVVLALTQLDFPFLFDGFQSQHVAFELAAVVNVVARNLVLLWLAVRAIRLLVQRCRTPHAT